MITFTRYLEAINGGFVGCCYIKEKRATYWLNNGQYHRKDGPAIIHDDGIEEWWLNDQRHNLNGYGWFDKKYPTNGLYYIFHQYYTEEEYWNHSLVQSHNAEKKLKKNT